MLSIRAYCPHVSASQSRPSRANHAWAIQAKRREGSLTTTSIQPPVSPIESLLSNIPDPILRAAVKEPVAFVGGVVSGLLVLDLTSDPLAGWLKRTAGSFKEGEARQDEQ
jgi:hypothetical protein